MNFLLESAGAAAVSRGGGHNITRRQGAKATCFSIEPFSVARARAMVAMKSRLLLPGCASS